MISKDNIILAIESVRSGAPPVEVFGKNFKEEYNQTKFDLDILCAIEELWLPIGDKAWIRLGYHDALNEIDKFLHPEKFFVEEFDHSKIYDDIWFF